MNLRIGVVLAVALLTACSASDPAPGGDGAPAAAAPGEPSDPAANGSEDRSEPDEWSLDTKQSAIDGRVLHATRRYVLADRGTWFQVDLTCTEATGRTILSIESYSGSPSAEESPGSAFLSDSINFIVHVDVPRGRAKPNGSAVMNLGDLFSVSNNYSNRLVLDSMPNAKAVKLPPGMEGVTTSDVNYARYVKELLPMGVEVMNENGAAEMVIDPSPNVIQTLDSCGAADDLVSAEALERIQQRQEKAQEEQAAEQERAAAQAAEQAQLQQEEAQRQQDQETAERVDAGRDCRSHGITNRRAGGRAIDCAQDMPDETVAFNADIDALLAVVAKHGFLCSGRGARSELVERAHFYGLQATQAYVQQTWCSNLLKVDVVPASGP